MGFTVAPAATPSASVVSALGRRPRRATAPSNLLPVGGAGLAVDGIVHADATLAPLGPVVHGMVDARQLGGAGPNGAGLGARRAVPQWPAIGSAGVRLAAVSGFFVT